MKAELFSSDFIISFFIFLSAFLLITLYYQNFQTDVSETSVRNDMDAKAISIASLLATTGGYPKYWNDETVEVIGLYDNGKFNLTKFEELKNVPYSSVRMMLGSGSYNINITLINVTGNILEKPSDPSFLYTYGTYSDNVEQLIIVKRLGVVKPWGEDASNATKVIMEVILWV